MPLGNLRWLVVLAGVVVVEGRASAIPYEVFIDVDDQAEILDLRTSGQISERTFDALILLFQTKVRLAQASRDRLYALPNLSLADASALFEFLGRSKSIRGWRDLVSAGVLDERLARSIRAFVLFEPAAIDAAATGFVRAQAQTSGANDRLPPAMALQARVVSFGALDVGVGAVVTRNDVGGLRWDAARRALSVTPERTRFVVPKLYLAWTRPAWGVVLGTYRIGFGQRLTFDVTDQAFPSGPFGDIELRRATGTTLRCKRSLGEVRDAPCPADIDPRVGDDYSWTNRLTGVAVGADRISLRAGWLEAFAWGSYQVRRVPRVELVDAAACQDPTQDDPKCAAPRVFVRESSQADPQSTLRFGSLPKVVAEGLAGARFAYSRHERARIGTTGYAAKPRWLVRGVRLGFQEAARSPFGGLFGAVGVDAAYGFARQDFFAEVTRSFDSQPQGGGFAALFRSLTDWASTELDVSLRYYGRNFANPYARSPSAPDERDGLRTRDEIGALIRSTTEVGRRASLRTQSNLWRRVSRPGLRADIFVRVDFAVSPRVVAAWWLSLRRSTTARAAVATRMRLELARGLWASLQYQHEWVAVEPFRNAYQGVDALASVVAQPFDLMRLRARVRYDSDDLSSRASLAETITGFVEIAVHWRDSNRLRLRHSVLRYIDTRSSTARRKPNPEHLLWLEYTFRF
ncbi:MAG: hypothetical protein AAF500_06360 [Myxococcota bacterium]